MLFTSEQVSEGHPDKVCDQISDALLTKYLIGDKGSRVGIETLIKNNHIVLAGEVTSSADIDKLVIEDTVRGVLTKIGLEEVDKYDITNYISEQSPDIALGTCDEIGGAGDQGMMFGYATDETEEMLPLPYIMATKALEGLKRSGLKYLRPDAKAQVTYDYTKNKIDTFLISTQHIEDISLVEMRPDIKKIMLEVSKWYKQNDDFKVLVNPTGRFVLGGSFGDAGVTGRKIVADTYGGVCRHGGGAFSGKDPTKVDRSAAYMCRKIARDLVGMGLAKRCEIQVAYAIGVAEPISISVNTFGTGKMDNEGLVEYIQETYDMTPKGIIDSLGLLYVDYNLTSSYGHFGKHYLPWEGGVVPSFI